MRSGAAMKKPATSTVRGLAQTTRRLARGRAQTLNSHPGVLQYGHGVEVIDFPLLFGVLPASIDEAEFLAS